MAVELVTSSLYSDANLVCYHQLEGNSNSTIGSFNGTDTSITYGTSYGKFNQGALFNGTSSKIALGASTGLNFSGVYTINFWVNPTSSQPDPYCHVLNKSSVYMYIISDGGANNNAFAWDNGTNTNAGMTAGSVTYDTWQMITITRSSGDSCKVYKNGSQIGAAQTIATDFSGNAYYSSQSGTGRYFKGSIDDISWFSRELSSTEILNFYNETGKKYSMALLGVG